MKKPKLAIFDMDGLMLDTEPLALAGWQIAARELDVAIPEELARSVIGFNRDLSKATMLKALGQDFDFERAIVLLQESVDKRFEELGVPKKPGLLELFDKLDALGIKKAVATSTAYERARRKLTMAGIAHRFEVIIGGDMVARSKPAPDIFLKAAEACGIAPVDCIVLEDSNPGAEGGYMAGMRVIVVPDLVQPTDLTRERAFAVVDSLYDVCEMLIM